MTTALETPSESNPLLAYGAWLAQTLPDWPEAALHSAHREFIDVVAVMIPGADAEGTRRVLAAARDWGPGPCSVVGAKDPMAVPWAAMINGTAGHALDFDDNFDPPKAHATTVLAPAILAAGENFQASGHACLDAYIAGLQIMGRVGQGLNPAHRNRGWHATATVGAIGAAAACARLRGLDAGTAAYALSIATSMSAGFMSQFGTMTKPLHAGLAAKAGVMAAAFAEAGVTAGLETLDGSTGMNHLMVGPDLEELRGKLQNPEHGQNLRFETNHVGEPLLILEHGFRVKRFPNCGSAHRALDGLLDLMNEHGFAETRVARIDVEAPRVHLNNLMHHDPRDPLQAKFSMEYALAVGLLTGNCTLADFTPEAVMRSEVRAIYDRIHLHPVDKPEGEFPTRVAVTLTDGSCLETTVAMPRGSNAAPFSDAEYWTKFDTCVTGHVPDERAAHIRDTLARLPALDTIGELMESLRA